MRIGSLFSGAGGLDLAVQAVFGGEVVWHAEIDKAASKVLAHHWPDIPNLGDITAVSWDEVPPVDILCGGFPCQDVSAAGKRAGIKHGTRSGLWSVMADAIEALQPQIVVVENVRGLLSAAAHRMEPDETTVGDGAGRPVLRAAGAVLGDLADLGYDAQWATVAAADIGAPHRRERVFIVATPQDSSGQRLLRPAATPEIHQPGDRHLSASGKASFTRPRNVLEEPNGWCEQCWVSDGASECLADPEYGDFIRGDGHGVDTPLLPTPVVNDMGDGKTVEQWDQWTADMKAKHGNGNGHGASLAIEVQRGDGHGVDVPLLPTPRSQDDNGYQQSPTADVGNNGHTVSLADRVTRLLPTPNASDASGGGAHPDNREGHSRQLIDYALLDKTVSWNKYEPAIRRWENLTRQAPPPTEPNKNGNPRLAAAFSEWLMGWPAGWVTDPNIGISRNDQLRIIGNGVCPQQAAYALNYLMGVA